MMSKAAMDHLFDHVLEGHAKTFEGIQNAKDLQLIDDEEYIDLMKKNTARLIDRIKEFKFIHRIVCVFFAAMFAYMQMNCEDLEMRRARSKVRRRQEIECPIIF